MHRRVLSENVILSITAGIRYNRITERPSRVCHQPVLLSCFLGRVDLSTIVNLERPRQRNTPEFLKLRGEILDHLHLAGGKTSAVDPS